MIVLTVLSYSGVPAEGLSARFDELGGSIGRADNNQLVLPDPERSISRLHARVVFRSGQYAIVDNGSNPIGVNGAAVPAGREQIIQPGDQVQIGSYLLAVSQGAASAATANPFADLFGGGGGGGGSSSGAHPAAAPAPVTAWTSPPMVAARPAPAAMPPMRASAAPSPPGWQSAAPAWPAPAAAPAAPRFQAPPPAPMAPAASALLADDWDFLAPAGAAKPSAQPFAPAAAPPAAGGWPASGGGDPAGLGLSMGPGAADSLDALFGLGNTPAGGDPLGAAPAQALLLQPNMAAHADPLRALSGTAQDSGASWADHGSELHTPMPLPKAMPSPVAASAPGPALGTPLGTAPAPVPAPGPASSPAPAAWPPSTATAAPTAQGAPSGAIFSWDDPPRDGRIVTLPGAPRAEPPASATAPATTPTTTPSAAKAGAGLFDDPVFGALFEPSVNPVSSAQPDPLVDPMAGLLAGTGDPLLGQIDGRPDGPLAPTAWPAPPPPPAPEPSTPWPTPPAPAPTMPIAQPAAAQHPAPPPTHLAGPPATPPQQPGNHEAALLAALRQGLGTPGLRLDSLTPELMHLIGQLLHESTRGAVELLVARAALKREMRAEMTMIVARENNPLKFSPSAEVALQHLLSPTAPGFMPAAPAVRDAFDDLRAHQLGVMAGMKAALDGVLQRFDPQQLEAKLTTRSAIDSILPATRKARLWESFQQLFSQLSSEAQDDFDELFGKAFLRAYQAQLDRLQAEPGPR